MRDDNPTKAPRASLGRARLTPARTLCYKIFARAGHDVRAGVTIRSSSMAEHSAVNRRVVGSSPTCGANSIKRKPRTARLSLYGIGLFAARRFALCALFALFAALVAGEVHSCRAEARLVASTASFFDYAFLFDEPLKNSAGRVAGEFPFELRAQIQLVLNYGVQDPVSASDRKFYDCIFYES